MNKKKETMQSVRAWAEQVVIPTYRTGEPDRNPMFLEKRVYQGSSGVVYPHPVIDKVFDEKEDKAYQALFLENEYLKIMILPEIGGRIQMAYDKTNDYHFIYHNQVIKPALVGLTGPWISGGIEFNWPQHHRPSTFEPVDFTITENDDGSKTVWVSEIEIMFHTKGMAGFTLYPGKAYLEVTGRLYNRTPFPQSFLWWANPAVEADDHYQSVFPPDVHAVYDHGKRDVSSFPIATGTYYKVDYSPGTDISRYHNIPVPTSYMAVNSDFDFVGGYHHRKKAGMLHVADHHISPGKKQWTWGSGEFGKTWDRQLTDPAAGSGEYRPYLEIMTGVYTDNQPDFSWIMPNEERVFKQYFFPYKEVGYVKNAGKDAVVNLEAGDDKLTVKVYVTAEQAGLRILLKNGERVLLDEQADLSPTRVFSKEIPFEEKNNTEALLLEVRDRPGRLLISYRPVKREQKKIPPPARAIGIPEEIGSNEDLYLAGVHLEQYRHATYSPVLYYQEALRRDPSDIRCNNALGLWYLKHGRFSAAAPLFQKAVEKLTRHNPNPYNGEPYYNLGLCLTYLGQWDEAYDAFYKASWNAAWQDNAFLQLAYIDCRRGDWQKALENVSHALERNYHGMKARHLKAVILRRLSAYEAAEKWIQETLSIDRFDFGSRYELYKVLQARGQEAEAGAEEQRVQSLMRKQPHSYIVVAGDYARAGCYEDAVAWLRFIEESDYPMVHYYLAYYLSGLGDTGAEKQSLQKASRLPEERVFPNGLDDILVLQYAVKKDPGDYKAFYYLGNLWYDKRQYEEAGACWERSAALCDGFPTAHRNLGIACYNKFNRPGRALQEYEKAFSAGPSDARVLFELDQLYKRMNKPVKERLAFLEQYRALVEERDDLYIEYVTLHHLSGHYEKAEKLLQERRFHPWEGGEGKVSKQYVQTKIARARQAIRGGEYDAAAMLLEEAQHYPENIGEGKLYGALENDIFYWLGCAHHARCENLPAEAAARAGQKAESAWIKATAGSGSPVQAVYYNDQDPAMIFYQGLALRKLGKEKEAKERFSNLVDYGTAHLDDKVKIDFFAVSLPELSVFDLDLDKRNRVHCLYLMGLGHTGLEDKAQADKCFSDVLKLDAAHQGALVHREIAGGDLIQEKK